MYAFLTLYLWQVLDSLQCVDNLRWLEVADRVRSFLKIFTFSARATNYTKQPWQYPSWPSVLTSCSCLKVLSFEKLFHKPITKIWLSKIQFIQTRKKNMHNHRLQCKQDQTFFSYMGIFMIQFSSQSLWSVPFKSNVTMFAWYWHLQTYIKRRRTDFVAMFPLRTVQGNF